MDYITIREKEDSSEETADFSKNENSKRSNPTLE